MAALAEYFCITNWNAKRCEMGRLLEVRREADPRGMSTTEENLPGQNPAYSTSSLFFRES